MAIRPLFFVLGVAAGLGLGCRPESAVTTSAIGTPAPQGLRVFDLSGQRVDPFDSTNAGPTVFLFIAVDCPIANRYAPEVQRLHDEFESRGVVFCLVYPDPDTSAEAVRKHRTDFRYSMRALRDPEHALVKSVGAKVTPEAALFDRQRRLVYRGRIDDRHVDFGKERAAPTQRDLREALLAVLEGRPVPVATTRAVGCYIPE